ncbi:MAG: hypothetical protein ACRDYV_20825, partial [Acidimicrobiia bacterium]
MAGPVGLSLRARLLAGVLVVVAAGLLGANLATYRALSTFLEQRVDGQLRDSRAPVFSELSRGGVFPGSRPSGRTVILSGTYAELRQAFGPIVRYVSPGQPRPELPDDLPAEEAYAVVTSSGNARFHWRILTT